MVMHEVTGKIDREWLIHLVEKRCTFIHTRHIIIHQSKVEWTLMNHLYLSQDKFGDVQGTEYF